MTGENEYRARAARHYFRGQMVQWGGSIACGGVQDDPPCHNTLFFDIDLDDLEGDSYVRSFQPGPNWNVLEIKPGEYQIYCDECLARKGVRGE